MSFFIRKSFRAGPIRLNLSKRGLGASTGVKGARIGVSSRGRAYVYGGRGGLYYRKELTGGRSRSPVRERAYRSTIVLEEDTGVTFANEGSGFERIATKGLLPPRPDHFSSVMFSVLPISVSGLVVFDVIAATSASGEWVVRVTTVALVLALLVWADLCVRGAIHAFRGRTFGRRMIKTLAEQLTRKSLSELVSRSKAEPADIAYHTRRGYLELMYAVVADGRVEDVELERLSLLEAQFDLEAQFISKARVAGFRKVYLEAVADHDLTESEERTLDHVRRRLGISEEDIPDELATVEQLSEVRRIRGGNLPEIVTTRKLQRGEVCHFEGPARLLKRAALRTFRQNGRRYKVEGLVIDKEGDLLITSKRLLFVHEGTFSVAHTKVLEVELNLDQNLLSITRDGAQKPVLITTPDAQRAAAVAAAAAGL